MTYILHYCRGLLMGIADLVPGVSGGTMALITGIYTRLINAIAAVNSQQIRQLFRGHIHQVWRSVDGWFLLVVFGGVLSAVFLFAGTIHHLLTHHPILTWSFFLV